MSEAFDPEQVERHRSEFNEGQSTECVRAADYDKLLALYREAVKPLSRQEKDFAWRQIAGNLRGDEIAEGIIRRRRETVNT